MAHLTTELAMTTRHDRQMALSDRGFQYEASDCGLLSSDLAAGMRRVLVSDQALIDYSYPRKLLIVKEWPGRKDLSLQLLVPNQVFTSHKRFNWRRLRDKKRYFPFLVVRNLYVEFMHSAGWMRQSQT
jgi:hypothetical protein